MSMYAASVPPHDVCLVSSMEYNTSDSSSPLDCCQGLFGAFLPGDAAGISDLLVRTYKCSKQPCAQPILVFQEAPLHMY